MYLQINMVKYDADREIMNIYENLREFTNSLIPVFTDMLLFVTIRLYSVYFKYLLVYRYSDSLTTNTNEELFSYF